MAGCRNRLGPTKWPKGGASLHSRGLDSEWSNVSWRVRMRAAREGDTHAAAETTGTYLAGVGTSGALLAGAAIVFVTLVGLASFDVWPGEGGGSSSSVVDLMPAEPEVEQAAAPFSPAPSAS